MLTETEANILRSLVELDSAVKSMATASFKPDLKVLFGKLDDLTSQLPRGTDPSLLHYMHKKSYQKAMMFLQGRDAENQVGDCGHVA